MNEAELVSIEIRFKSFEYSLLRASIEKVNDILKSELFSSYIRLESFFVYPKKQKRFTVLRSPHVHKKSREQFEIQTHKAMCLLSFSFDSTFQKDVWDKKSDDIKNIPCVLKNMYMTTCISYMKVLFSQLLGVQVQVTLVQNQSACAFKLN